MTQHSAKIIDGKKIADDLLADLRKKIADLPEKPGLAVLLVGADEASRLYVRNKKKAAQKVGITFHEYRCDTEECLPDITQEELIKALDWLNNDDAIDGIIIQLPLPQRFNTQQLIDRLDPAKDVDGFHELNRKAFLDNEYQLTPPLIDAINTALDATDQNLTDKTVAIVSKNPIFSEPLTNDLERRGCLVRTIHPDDLLGSDELADADIVISITGNKHSITKDMVKDDVIAIDVGVTKNEDGTFAGDFHPMVADVASWITPVPGGIGPLTVAMLLKNVYELRKNK